jgi:hypothetical protein
MTWRVSFLSLLFLWLGMASIRCQLASDLTAQHAEPGVTYGHLQDLPLPRTILFSAGPDEIAADAEGWARHGIQAFFLDFVARDWSSDIWAADGEPWTIGKADKSFQKTKRATEASRRIGSEVFLKVAFDHPFDWFNDTAWQQIVHNFRQFAIFARDSGCHGVALDIEYVGEQYDYTWAGYRYDGYTRRDLFRKVQERMTQVVRALYDEFPGLVLLTFPECGLSLGSAIQAAWIEEAARRNAPGGVHYCTEYTYRNPNIRFMFGHAVACNELFQRLLSSRARKYWAGKCTIAAGVWPLGSDYQTAHNPGLSVGDFRQGIAASLMLSRRYNWIYSHNSREQLLGRELGVYTNGVDILPYLKIMAEREIVTTPKYVALAKEIRQMRRRDFAWDLGLATSLSVAGPRDLPILRLLPPTLTDAVEQEGHWQAALEEYHGKAVDFHEHFGTLTHWLLLGPFPNGEPFAGHSVAYPPEQGLDLRAEYDGVIGKVRWQEYQAPPPAASVDLTKVFKPTEHVTAYALGYLTSSVEREVQLRLGSNDAAKLWVGGKLLLDYPLEGTAYLDRDVLATRLPRGTTPILLKVSNRLFNWGFVFRITDQRGHPLRDLQWSLAP